MDLCFLVSGFPTTGDGPTSHAERLAARHDVTIALCDERPLPGSVAPAMVALEDALACSYDVAVAFHWPATVALFEVDARRRVYHVDRFAHETMAAGDPLRVAAQISYDLPVDLIAAAPWIARRLAELRPDARCLTVTAGVARGEADGDHAPVVILDRDPVGEVLAGRVVVASVTSPGIDDLITHGENGFLIEPEDRAGAAQLVDELRGDDALRARVAAAARATPWPDPDAAATALEAALRELLDTDPPADGRWPRRLMADALSALTTLPGPR